MSHPVRALVALVVGIAIGVAASESPALARLPSLVAPVGTLWVNAIRMTVVPLVVALLISSVAAAADPRAIGRVGLRAVVVFVSLLSIVAAATALVAPAVFAHMPIDPAGAARLRAEAVTTPPKVPGITEWILSLVPVNPVAAAAEGAMLPLIVFTLAFGLALAHARVEAREPVVAFFRGVSEAVLVLIGGVLLLAPVGVFALSVGIGARLGATAAGTVGFYLVAYSALIVAPMLLLYPIAVLVGRVSPRRFARACLPAQVVGASSRSSMAALPALIDGAEHELGLPRSRTALTLPLAVSLFRLNQAVTWTVMALFLAKLYDVPFGPAAVAGIAATSVAMSFAVPGIPSGGLFVVTPFYIAAGLPAEGVGILLALDPIPDVFKTMLNVTGHMTATVVLARDERVGKTS